MLQAVERTIPLEIVHPEVRRCFLRCFNDGYQNPNLRPTAKEWLEALKVANDKLILCGRVDSHYYSRTYGKCYWCDRSTKLGVDIFPGKETSTFVVKASTSYPTLHSTNQQLSNKNQINKNNQFINTILSIVITLISIALVSFIKSGIRSLFSPSNNFIPTKSELEIPTSNDSQELQELTKSQLRAIANSEIEAYTIGIGISFQFDEKNKIPIITDILDKSPAALGNLKIGDQILEVNGQSTLDMSVTDVAKLIQGDVNTAVFLLVGRQGFRNTSTMLIRERFINHNLEQDYVNRCSARFQLEDFSNALDDCNEAVKLNFSNDEAYFLLGASHIMNGDKYKGIEYLQKSASLGNKKARKFLKDIQQY